jgi:formyltetrahydrofolate-dependent phosphoribosylglycinamide formyltransferase
MKRIVVLISGGGTNLQALIDACTDGRIAGKIVLVLSNRREAFGMARARRAGITAEPFGRTGHASRLTYDTALADRIAEAKPDLVVLAGWMHILGASFLERCPAKVINLHPALPGMFPGTEAIERALAAFRRGEIAETGVMVHEVIAEVDAGPVLGTADVPILPSDDLESLSIRMHAAEHRLLVHVVADLATGT